MLSKVWRELGVWLISLELDKRRPVRVVLAPLHLQIDFPPTVRLSKAKFDLSLIHI